MGSRTRSGGEQAHATTRGRRRSGAHTQHPAPLLPTSQQRTGAISMLARQAPPSRPRTPVRERFGELRTALAEGWEIVQPIFARPLWSAADDSATAFNFVLKRERSTRLVTVPEGRTVERFIRDRQLNVDYGH